MSMRKILCRKYLTTHESHISLNNYTHSIARTCSHKTQNFYIMKNNGIFARQQKEEVVKVKSEKIASAKNISAGSNKEMV